MKETTYKTHQKILGAMLVAYSAMNIFAAVSVIISLGFVRIFIDEPELIGMITLFSQLISAIMLVVSIPALAAGIGMIREKEWSKALALIVGVVYLLFIPIGTVIGIYSIWLSSQQIYKEKEPLYATDLVKNYH